ncbi:MAG: AAA family ATPase [Planctomycetia bacterium]|nr:AAA family ATPase [Planctomycetia bacterium]
MAEKAEEIIQSCGLNLKPVLHGNICPFTVFATFHCGIKIENRVTVLRKWAEFLELDEEVPTSFEGIPVADNVNFRFYGVSAKAGTKEKDSLDLLRKKVDSLWELFEAGIRYADNPDEQSRDWLIHAGNGLGYITPRNTMGLYWIRSNSYLTLDSRSRNYLKKYDIKIRSHFSIEEWLEWMREVRLKMADGTIPARSFPELSYDAWVDDEKAPQMNNDRGVYWFVGTYMGKKDQSDRLIREGIWEYDFLPKEDFREYKLCSNYVKSMRKGDRIALKTTYVRFKNDIPFENYGKKVSVMGIRAIGTITENPMDGSRVKVHWDEVFSSPKEWFFSTSRKTIWRVKPEEMDDSNRWKGEALIQFAFHGKPQDISRFLGSAANQGVVSYSLQEILREGCFQTEKSLGEIFRRLELGKNLILQGPPGTGKTWLAKRLAYALVGSKSEEKVKSVQFHPNMTYEDFVRGWRPDGRGHLSLIDGPFLKLVNQAKADSSSRYVLVIEEINRGNPAQIFGELLTLIEADKRSPDEAMELTYSLGGEGEERIYVPPNLYLIGTMNVADRSLALVDFALRRRFVYATLKPELELWKKWMIDRGFEKSVCECIQRKLSLLNDQITKNLGEHLCVGHSYVTPPEGVCPADLREWFRDVVSSKIVPLLQEYWFDEMEKAQNAEQLLLE